LRSVGAQLLRLYINKETRVGQAVARRLAVRRRVCFMSQLQQAKEQIKKRWVPKQKSLALLPDLGFWIYNLSLHLSITIEHYWHHQHQHIFIFVATLR
jgi:hypothetical protein